MFRESKWTEDERREIRVAAEVLKECETYEELHARIEEFRELHIDYEPVGICAIVRLEKLGIFSEDERYMAVERHFKFRTVEDYQRASWEEIRSWPIGQLRVD